MGARNVWSIFFWVLTCLADSQLVPNAYSQDKLKKVALIVGNGDYNLDGDFSDTGDLLATQTDVRAMESIFRDLSFDQVITANNVRRNEFRDKVAEFRRAGKDADVAVFYFSGHGLVPPEGARSKKQNYLVPVGVDFSDPEIANDLEALTIPLSYVRRQVERPGLTTVFLLDACRNNPFGNQIAKSVTGQVGKSVSVSKGLIVENVAGAESFVAFAARDGEVAIAPTDGSLSYFTQALVEYLPNPDSIQNNISRVRGHVLDLTFNKQRPQTFGELNRPLYLGAVSEPVPNIDVEQIRDDAVFSAAKRQNTPAAFESYLAGFPNGAHRSEAQTLIASLVPDVRPAPIKPSEPVKLPESNNLTETVKPWEKTYGGGERDGISSLVLTSDDGALLGGYTESKGAGEEDMYLVRVDAKGNKLWDKAFGGGERDGISSLVLTFDGGALLGGYTESKGAGNGDMYLVRVDAKGNKLWDKTFGGGERDGISSLVLTSDGGALLGGYTESKGAGEEDMYLVRVDADGNKLWDKTFGGKNSDQINSLVLTSDGGALLGGFTESKGDGSGDMYLVRVDADGNKLWDKTYGGKKWDQLNSLTLTADGEALLGGYTLSSAGFIDMYLVRVDAEGSKLWEKTYGGSDAEWLNSLVLTADGGALLGGIQQASGNYDMYLVRVDANGNKLWDKTYGGNSRDEMTSLVLTADGGALLGGTNASEGAGGYDMYLVRLK